MRQFYEQMENMSATESQPEERQKRKNDFYQEADEEHEVLQSENNKPFVTFAPFVVSSGGPISELQYDAS